MKYLFNFVICCWLLISFEHVKAHPNCLMVLLRKIKGESGYHRIGDSKPILETQKKRHKPLTDDIEIPTLAQDPVAYARFIWGFQLSFFDKN